MPVFIFSSVTVCFLIKETNFKEPVKALSKEEMENLNLKYYNPEIHKASFVLPEFARKVSLFKLQCVGLNNIVASFFFICSLQYRYSAKHDQQHTFLLKPQTTCLVLQLLHLVSIVQYYPRESSVDAKLFGENVSFCQCCTLLMLIFPSLL